jgi:hypothetical protein
MNYLDPVLVHAPWTSEEDQLVDAKFAEYGTQWQVIAMFLPTRSRNQIKNRWHALHKSLPPPVRGLFPPPPLPAQDDLCEPPLKTKVCSSIFSESRPEEMMWGDFFAGFF